jgi:hypothetical protein
LRVSREMTSSASLAVSTQTLGTLVRVRIPLAGGELARTGVTEVGWVGAGACSAGPCCCWWAGPPPDALTADGDRDRERLPVFVVHANRTPAIAAQAGNATQLRFVFGPAPDRSQAAPTANPRPPA